MNDYTIHSHAELEAELETLRLRIRDRALFIEKQVSVCAVLVITTSTLKLELLQMVARKATTVPAKELEEFDSAFRSFDKDSQGRLDLDQLAGALGALGVAEIMSTI